MAASRTLAAPQGAISIAAQFFEVFWRKFKSDRTTSGERASCRRLRRPPRSRFLMPSYAAVTCRPAFTVYSTLSLEDGLRWCRLEGVEALLSYGKYVYNTPKLMRLS